MASAQLNWNFSKNRAPRPCESNFSNRVTRYIMKTYSVTTSQILVPNVLSTFSHSIIPRLKQPANNCFWFT